MSSAASHVLLTSLDPSEIAEHLEILSLYKTHHHHEMEGIFRGLFLQYLRLEYDSAAYVIMTRSLSQTVALEAKVLEASGMKFDCS